MLEDPSYGQVVRWGNGGNSFVVLEVGLLVALKSQNGQWLIHILSIEREIYQVHLAKTFQTQQLCKLRSSTEQIRFS